MNEGHKKQLERAHEVENPGMWTYHVDSGDIFPDEWVKDFFHVDQGEDLKTFVEALHPSDRDDFRRVFNRARENRSEYTISVRVQSSDGPVRVRVQGKYVRAHGDESDRIMNSIRGETESGDGEEDGHGADRERQFNLFRKALNEGPDGILIVDPETNRFLDFTRSVERMLGYTREELLSMDASDINPEVGTEVKSRDRLEQSKKKGPVTYETIHQRKDGSTFPVEVRASFTPIEDDRQVVVATIRDITERRKMERERTNFKQAVEASGHGVLITDPDGNITYVNPALERMTGFDADEITGQPMDILNSGVHDEDFWSDFWDTIQSGETWEGEVTNRRKSGETFEIYQTVAPVFDEKDSLRAYIAVQEDLSRTKQLQKKYEEQARFLREINDQIPGVPYQFRKGPDGAYSFPYVSEGLWDIFGITSEEAMADFENLDRVSGPDDIEDLFRAVKESARSMEQFQYDFRIDHPEKGEIWVRASAIPRKNEDETITWSGICLDITDRKKRERDLMRQKQRFEILFEEAPIGLWEEDWSGARTYLEERDLNDPERVRAYFEQDTDELREVAGGIEVLLANRAVVEMVGAEDKEYLKEHFVDSLTDDAFESVLENIISLVKGQHSSTSIMKIRRFDGEMRYIQRDLHVIPEFADTWERVFVSYQDITEQKKMEDSLRESERHYRTLFEEANEAFLIENLDDVILDANQSACDLLGYPREELIGMRVENVIPADQVGERDEEGIVQSRLHKYGTSLFQSEYLHRDSTRIPVEISKRPMQYGDMDAVLTCIRDRTEVEEVRRESRMKSTFVSRVTHDLRTPLNSITGIGSLLLDTRLSAEQRDYIQTVLNAARHMERLTNDILDLDRIERGKITLNERPFSLGNLLGEVFSLYGTEIEERDIQLTADIADEIPEHLVGDPDRLQQILHNLVENAVRHTREGSIKVAVTPSVQWPSESLLAFSVSDTGDGIPEEKQEEIFERHRQAPGKTERSSEHGLGLGLSICRELVEMMGGEISVESTPGEGTVFTFTVEVEEAGEPVDVNLENVSVLLVDDSQPMRNVFRTYLESHNMTVEERDTGKGALDELEEAGENSPYDVVFMDHRMGDLSGLDVIQELANTPEAMDTEQIYLVSGDVREDMQKRIRSVPVAGLLEKPIKESELINAVRLAVESPERVQPLEVDDLVEEIQRLHPGPIHTLVVDDDHSTRKLLEVFLEPFPGNVSFATTGSEAVSKRRGTPEPDLILMDYELQEMDGVKATQEIRDMESRQNLSPVPIIAQTAMAMTHVEDKFFDAGADKFLCKPIRRPELYRAIREVFQNRDNNE